MMNSDAAGVSAFAPTGLTPEPLWLLRTRLLSPIYGFDPKPIKAMCTTVI